MDIETIQNMIAQDKAMYDPEIQDVSGLRGLQGISQTEKQQQTDTYNAIEALRQSQAERARIAPVQNVGELYNPSNNQYSTYDQEVKTLEDLSNIDAFRARQQSGFLKATNAIIGGLASGLGTYAENLAYIFDIKEHAKAFTDVDGVEGNAFSNGAKQYKEWIDSAMPIYETPAEGFADSFFRWSTLKSGIDSMLGFALPGGTVVKAIGLVGKALRGARLAAYLGKLAQVGGATGKALNWTGNTINKAGRFINYGPSSTYFNSAVSGFITNDAEGKMMAIELKEEADRQYINTYSKAILEDRYNNDPRYANQAIEDAKAQMQNDTKYQLKVAKEQDRFVNTNRIFMLTDALALHGIFKGKGLTRNKLRDPESYKFLNSIKRLDSDNWMLQMSKEGLEEVGQNVLQSEGEFQIGKASNTLSEEQKELEDKTVFERILAFATSDQSLVEGAMGFLTGGLQRHIIQAGYDILSGDTITGDKRKQERLIAYQKQQDEIASYTANSLKNIIQGEELQTAAAATDQEYLQDFISDTLFTKQLSQSFEMGTAEELERAINDIANMSAEEAEKLGYNSTYKEDAIKRIEQLVKAEKTWLRYQGFIGQSQIFENRLDSDNFVSLREEVYKELNQAKNEFAKKYPEVELDSAGNAIENKQNQDDQINIRNFFDAQVVNNSPEAQKIRSLQEKINAINEAILETDKEFQLVTSEEFQKSLRKRQKEFIDKQNKDLNKEVVNKKAQVKRVVREQVEKAQTPETKQEVINKVREEDSTNPIVTEAVAEVAEETREKQIIEEAINIPETPIGYEELSELLSTVTDEKGNIINFGVAESAMENGMSMASPKDQMNLITRNIIIGQLLGHLPNEAAYNPNTDVTSIKAIKEFVDKAISLKGQSSVHRAVINKLKDFVDSAINEAKKVEEATSSPVVPATINTSETDFSRDGDVAQTRKVVQQVNEVVDKIVKDVAESNRDSEEPKGKVSDDKKQENFIVRSAFSWNSIGYLSRNYERISTPERVYNRNVDNELNLTEVTRNALNSELTFKGKEIQFEILDQDELPIYNSTTRTTSTWGEYKQQISESDISEDLKIELLENKIPIAIKSDDQIIGFIHDLDWPSEFTIFTPVEADKEALQKTRRAILDGTFTKTTITRRSPGFLAYNKDKSSRIPFNEVFKNPDLKLVIRKNDTIIGNINTEEFKDSISYAIENIPNGYTCVALKDSSSQKTFIIPVYRDKLKEEQVVSITQAIRIFINAKSGNLTDADKHTLQIINENIGDLIDNNQQPINLDITSTAGLRNYISLFTYLYPAEKMNLSEALQSKDRDYKALSIEENNDTIMISFGEGRGVNIKTLKIEKTGSNAGLPNGPLDFFESLEAHLRDSNFYSNAKYLSIQRVLNIPFIGRNGAITTKVETYEDLLKENVLTRLLEFNLGTEENPKYIYCIQPKIEFNNPIIEGKSEDSQEAKEEKSEEASQKENQVYESTKLGTIDLTETEEDNTEFSLRSITPEEFDTFRKAQEGVNLISSDIQHLKLVHQRQLVDVVASDIMTQVITSAKLSDVDTQEIFEDWKKEFTNLKNAFDKANNTKKAVGLEVLLNNWSNFQTLVINKLKTLGNINVKINEKSDSIAEIEGEENVYERNRFTDTFSLEVDSKDTVSFRIKQFLANIKNPTKEFYLNPNYKLTEPFDVVYNTVQAILAGTNANFDEMIDRLKGATNIAWMPDLIRKLQEAPQQIKQEFVVAMNKHYVHMEFARLDGKSMQVWDANANSMERGIAKTWSSSLLLQPLVELKDGEYVYNKEQVQEIKAIYDNWVKEKSYPDKETLNNWLNKMGIELSERTLDTLINGQFQSRGVQYSYGALFGKNNSLFGDMMSRLVADENISGKDHDLLGSTLAKSLIALEAENSVRTFSNSHRAGSKTVYSFTNDKYAYDRFYALKHSDLLERLAKLPFSKESWWLKLMTEDGKIDTKSKMYDTFDISYLSLSALNLEGGQTLDDNSLNNLSPEEHEIIKLTMFFNNGSIGTDTASTRVGKFFYPTMSDKTNMFLITSLLYNINIEPNGSVTRNVVNFIYNNIVQSEINRMLYWQQVTQGGANPVNIDAYNEGATKFLFFPQLNNIDELFITNDNGVRVLKASVLVDEELQNLIKQSLREFLNSSVDEQISDWNSKGIGLIEGNSLTHIDSKYLQWVRKQSNVNTTKDALRFTAVDYVVNNIISNANVFQLFLGDPALYYKSKASDVIQQTKDTFINIGKRLAGDNAPGMEADFSKIAPTFNLAVVRDTERPSIGIEFYKRLGLEKEYSKINGSDAQELTTADEHIDVMYAFGKLSEEEYNTIKNKIKANEDLNSKELSLILQPIKPVYVNNTIINDVADNQGIDVRRYVKSSSFPLLPQLTKGLEIDKLRQMMENKGIQRLAFESAVKIGAPKIRESIINKDGTLNDEALNKVEFITLPREGFKIQQEVPYHEDKDAINRGTQEAKLLFANIKSFEGFKYKGQDYTGEQLEKIYTETYRSIFEKKYKALLEELGVEQKLDPITGEYQSAIDPKKLEKILLEEAIKRGYSTNDLLGLTLNEQGEFKFPLWSLPAADKYESLLLSIVDNRVRKIKLPGMSYILGTQEGFKVIRDEDEAKQKIENLKSDIVWTSSWTGELLNQRYSEDGKTVLPSQILVPSKIRDSYGNLIDIKKYAKRDSNGRLMLNERAIPKDLLKIFGFRIPTQGHSSMMGMEIVGFLPDFVGDLCIASRDLTVQMGSDFDVDKLYTYNFSLASVKNKDGKIIFKKVNDLTKEESARLVKSDVVVDELISALFGEDVTKEDPVELKKLYNDLLDIHLAVLSNPNEELQHMIASPISFGNLKGGDGPYGNLASLINNWRETRLNSNQTFSGLSPLYQRTKYINATAGKSGVAVFSAAMVFLASAQNKDISYVMLTPEGDNIFQVAFGDKKSNGDLSGVYALGTKRPRTKVMEAFQSSSVDNENEQILDKLNINAYTFNVINALVMMGFEEKEIVSLIAQDIIFEYVNKQVEADSQLSKSTIKDTNTIVESLLIGLYNKVANQNPNLLKEDFEKEYSKYLTADADTLLEYIQKGEQLPEYYFVQAAMLIKFSNLEEIGKKILAVQNTVNTDSKGLGKSFLESVNKEVRIKELSTLDRQGELQVGIQNAASLLGNISVSESGELVLTDPTLLGSSVLYALLPANKLFSNLFPYNKVGPQNAFDNLAKAINPFSFISGASKDKLSYTIFQALKSYLYTNKDLFGIEDVNAERQRLLIDKWDNKKQNIKPSLASKIATLQRTPYGQRNAFLSRLTTFINKNGQFSTVTYNAASGTNLDESDIYQGFSDLLVSTVSIPTGLGEISLREIGKDLISYAYLTGGIQRANEFVRYVPIEILNKAGLGDLLKEVNFNQPNDIGIAINEGVGKLQYSTLGKFERQFIQNNPKLIKARISRVFTNNVFDIAATEESNGIKINSPIIGVGDKSIIDTFIPTKQSHLYLGDILGVPIYAEYVTTRVDKSYILYKYDGMQYNRVPTLGSNFVAEYDMNSDNLGWSTSILPDKFKAPAKEASDVSRPIAPKEVENQASSLAQLKASLGIGSNNKQPISEILRKHILISDSTASAGLYLLFADNMARVIQNRQLDSKISIEFADTSIAVAAQVQYSKDGTYEIKLNPTLTFEEASRAILHEVSHIILRDVLHDKNKNNLSKRQQDLIKRLDALRKLAIEKLGAEKVKVTISKVHQWEKEGTITPEGFIKEDILNYSTLNLSEFAAAALTSAEFRQVLKDINIGDETLWNKIAKFLLSLLESLGIYDRIKDGQTALLITEETILNLMEDSKIKNNQSAKSRIINETAYSIKATNSDQNKLDKILQEGKNYNLEALVEEVKEKYKHC